MSSGDRKACAPGPTEPLLLTNDLSLNPRLKLLLTFYRSDLSVKSVDEWQLKRALLSFLRDSLSLSLPDEDLTVKKQPDLQKRKREDAVATGVVHVRDLGFLTKRKYRDGEEEDADAVRTRFAEWKEDVVRRIDGIELNLEGVKFRSAVEVPLADDFDRLRKSWEEFCAWRLPPGNRHLVGASRRPDTVVIKGVPSRWFAEPRVSSKPSMLVTHTIFSALGKIRNINVVADDNRSNIDFEEPKSEIVSGLHCNIFIQFEDHETFCSALNALSGRSLQKQGSRLKADYVVTWDRHGYFRNVSCSVENNQQERVSRLPASLRRDKMETSRHQPQIATSTYSGSGVRLKRFRE